MNTCRGASRQFEAANPASMLMEMGIEGVIRLAHRCHILRHASRVLRDQMIRYVHGLVLKLAEARQVYVFE